MIRLRQLKEVTKFLNESVKRRTSVALAFVCSLVILCERDDAIVVVFHEWLTYKLDVLETEKIVGDRKAADTAASPEPCKITNPTLINRCSVISKKVFHIGLTDLVRMQRSTNRLLFNICKLSNVCGTLQ